ncbi:MAG: hypothetical protein IPJ98_28000 [Bryobacterales bacterium]|nr:hypothetical protein [Bryobacterales bacterium]
MTIHTFRSCLLAGAVLFASGCGKQERSEAVQLAKTLQQQKATFDAANAAEQDLVTKSKAWCRGIMESGAGKGTGLDQNAAQAAQFAKDAVAISTQLSQVRQGIDAVSLTEEFPRGVKNELTTALTKRQRLLHDLRTLADQLSPQFLAYKGMKDYAGDSYPDGLTKFDEALRTHMRPDDSVATAIAALQEKFEFAAGEI